jgi:hypothetical protein
MRVMVRVRVIRVYVVVRVIRIMMRFIWVRSEVS